MRLDGGRKHRTWREAEGREGRASQECWNRGGQKLGQ